MGELHHTIKYVFIYIINSLQFYFLIKIHAAHLRLPASEEDSGGRSPAVTHRKS
jgi:hypothetical protein